MTFGFLATKKMPVSPRGFKAQFFKTMQILQTISWKKIDIMPIGFHSRKVRFRLSLGNRSTIPRYVDQKYFGTAP